MENKKCFQTTNQTSNQIKKFPHLKSNSFASASGWVCSKSPPLSPEIDAEEGTMEPAAAAMFKAWSPKGFFKCGSARAWP